MAKPRYADSVFINCPFDDAYLPIFQAVVFAVFDCGYVVRCSLEIEDSSEVRIEKIGGIIAESRYGIHDISRIEPDPNSGYPRFNMPLELGLFLGAKRYGETRQKQKRCIILDSERYRFQAFLSDISGQDIKAHLNSQQKAITIIRNWLSTTSGRKSIPGGKAINRRYKQFRNALPDLCDEMQIEEDELTYLDYVSLIAEWLQRV